MKQLLQSLRSGEIEIVEVPEPSVGTGELLISTRRSLVSAGTEKMLQEFGKANLLSKAHQQPDKVKQVLEKMATDGVLHALKAVRNKLDQPIPLGYCNAGVVVAVGEGVEGFEAGDRVTSNGCHAEMVNVPFRLCAQIPRQVSFDDAAFTVIGAIALQGVRLLGPGLGESIAVMGLGLVGQITVQLLLAAGCRVLAIDLDAARLERCARLGAEVHDLSAGPDPIGTADRLTAGRGVDGVIVAAATQSSKPIHQAATMCRQRAKIVLVGSTGLKLSRADFYEKELEFQVSCSYGPGRYDPEYEEGGKDYPYGLVRWTEQRNFGAFLQLVAAGKLSLEGLVTHRFPLERAPEAYRVLGGGESSLGVLFEYPEPSGSVHADPVRTVALAKPAPMGRRAVVGFIGAGQYAGAVLAPAFSATGARLKVVASRRGLSGLLTARKVGFEQATTDVAEVFGDHEIDAVVIATRHDSHAELVLRALDSGKHVFVEKPLCLTLDELGLISSKLEELSEKGVSLQLMVGFNRRFAPVTQKIKQHLEGSAAPKAVVMTVNAGAIPAEHWTQRPGAGGGRIIGEACHFVDLMRFLVDAPIVSHHAVYMGSETQDTANLQLSFEDGSIGSIHYLANGTKSFPKERIEVFSSGRILQIDNFKALKVHGKGWAKGRPGWIQDKGQKSCVEAFIKAVERGGAAPIPVEQLLEVSLVTIELASRE